MKKGAEILEAAFSEAQKPGAELAPSALLNSVLKRPDPFAAMADHDQAMEIYGAFQSEFGFLNFVSATGQLPPTESVDRFAALLRWTMREIHNWREAGDPHFHKLTTLFIVASCCDFGDAFWDEFPAGLDANTGLLSALEMLIRRLAVSFSTRGPAPPPIWETEAVERFKKANDERDWAAITDLWRQFEHATFPGLVLVQSVRCLGRFGFDCLVRGLDDNRQVATALQVASVLAAGPRLRLGLASKNHYVQFAAILISISAGRGASALTADDEGLLAQILARAAMDNSLWAGWMLVFNRYPMRYPVLQVPLGSVLAGASQAALKAYIDAVLLYGSQGNGRDVVAVCLRSFRATASVDQQKALWKIAFERWQTWGFIDAIGGGHLIEVGTSALDYAVVGYALECLTDGERCDAINEIYRLLRNVDLKWYESSVDCTSEWYRLLSQWQPYYHAIEILRTPQDWLAQNRQYLPFDPKIDRYAAMKFHMRNPPQSSG